MNSVFYGAIFLTIWSVVLFIFLPINVKPIIDTDDMQTGHEPGAPQKTGLKKKLLLTTLTTAIIFACFYYVAEYTDLSISDLRAAMGIPTWQEL